MRIVFAIQDSMPNGRVGPEFTPHLWKLISQGGGWSPAGGRSVLASSTYPNHASFVTGTDVQQHRIFTNDVWDGTRFVPSATVGPVGETIFDIARAGGVSTAAVLGDQVMVPVMTAERADVHWPPQEQLGPGVGRDALGYAGNSAVLDAIDSTYALDADLCFVHFNEPDSSLHRFGPGAQETLDTIRACDRDLAELVEKLRPAWDDTILFVVSDHEQEQVDANFEPIDMKALLDSAGLPGHVNNEGTVALIVDGPAPERVAELPEIEAAVTLDEGIVLAWSSHGRVFGAANKGAQGQHGSPRTQTQVASVAGGHPMVASIAESLEKRVPHATDWAPTIAAMFGLDLAEACLLYTSPSPRDRTRSRMPSSA